MFIYTHSTKLSTQPNHHHSASKRRAAFARSAVYEEFQPHHARAIDQADFLDRAPDQAPRALGTITTKITHDTNQKSLRYWLNQAGRADSEEEREAALRTAHKIARVAGLKVDLPRQRAAQ